MSPIATFLLTVALGIATKTCAWLLQLRTRNAGIVDAIWAFTLGAMALIYGALGDSSPALRLLMTLMGLGWGLRLGLHLLLRNRGAEEDWRYARMRSDWGAQANRNMLLLFQFQNLFSWALAATAFLPVAYGHSLPAWPWLLLSITIWAGSVAGEALADRQLARFRADPAHHGQVCRVGLWRLSRHPNYFFESLHWLAYAPLAIGGPLWGAVSLLAPIIMALLLMKLSGVPLLEREMLRRKAGYADYVRTTNALIPWPPRT